jgi:hypothetical protein
VLATRLSLERFADERLERGGGAVFWENDAGLAVCFAA